MVGSGKIAGLLMIGGAAVIEALAVLWLAVSLAGGQLQAGGAVLGLGCAQALALPLAGIGVFLLIKGRKESAEFAAVEKQRAMLNMVQTQGRVKIADMALQLRMTRDEVQKAIYDLVGMGLFTGYVNWNEGVLVSKTAGEMKSTKCPNCGGEREVAGQGVVKCPYCGSELFVS